MKTVCLFVKSPRPGETKTRLARDIGAKPATLIYRALVDHQAAEIPVDWGVAVYFAPSNAAEELIGSESAMTQENLKIAAYRLLKVVRQSSRDDALWGSLKRPQREGLPSPKTGIW
jgi:glycosyltransferase A (GT-A) superfamily protein (DUF2064 family)